MMHSNLRLSTAFLCFALSIAFAVSPFFVTSFAGFDPNQFPIPQDKPPVQPAGYAFAIWGVIYGWLIIGTAWGMFKAPRDGQWHDMRRVLCVSLALGVTWLSIAVLSPIWATVVIWLMLLTGLAALFVAPVSDRVWAAYPVGLYTGWLSGASCVSLGLLAAGYGFLDQNTAALIFIALAVVIGASVQAAFTHAPTYGIGVIWALVGIVVANWDSTRTIAYVAAIGAVVVLLATLRALQKG